MNFFKKALALLLCALFLTFLCSCSLSISERDRDDSTSEKDNDKKSDKKGELSAKKAAAAAEDFINTLLDGDIEAINTMLPLGNLLYSGEDTSAFAGGIINDIIASMTYSIEEKSTLEDGTALIKLKIENTDLKALLLSLPEGISSKEEAREKMKSLRPTAARKVFDAELIVSYDGVGEKPQIICTPSFANAITGGINDILTELIGEEFANEKVD